MSVGAGSRPLVDLWETRTLLAQWVRRDFVVRYRQSALGVAWALVQPLMLLLFYGVVFVQVLDVDPGRGSYVVFAFCGLAPWTFFVNAISWGSPSLTNSAGIIRQVYFPRALVPLAAGGVVLVDLSITTSALLVMQIVAEGSLHLSVVALVPIYLGMAMLIEALVVLVAIVTAFIRDIRFVVPFGMQVGFIATPIMYSSAGLDARWQRLLDLNPMARIIESIRGSVIDGRWPSPTFLVVLLVSGAGALVLVALYSRSVEQRLPDLL